jgi:hypothetical protein
MFRNELVTEIEIDALPERVWEILTDLGSYPEWNPMIRRASGEIKAGARVKVRFEPQGARGHTFRPKLLVVEPNRELRWLGWPRFPGLFDSEHYWTMEGKMDAKTLLKHGVLVYGLFAPLAGKAMMRTSEAPFKAMNHALKDRAESERARLGE